MFACIYFEEDASLSVVNKNDSALNIISDFSVRGAVEMSWRLPGKSKELFHGTIIKVGDSENALVRFATAAHKSVVKDKYEPGQKVPEELFKFQLSAGKSSGKRERTETKLMKESKEQEATLSPKKRKIKDKVSEAYVEPIKSRTSSTPKKSAPTISKPSRCADGTALQTGKKMLPLMEQFLMDTSSEGKQATEDEVPGPSSATVQATDTIPSVTEEQLPGTDCLLQPFINTPPIVEVSEENCKTSHAVSQSDESQTSFSLTNTWQTCQNAMAFLGTQQIPSRQIPMPSPEVLQTLRAVCQPEFVNFVRNLTDHFQQPSNCSHPCFQPQVTVPQHSFYMDLMDDSDINNSMPSYDHVPEDVSGMCAPSKTSTPAKTANYISLTTTSSNAPPRRSPRKQPQKSNEKAAERSPAPKSTIERPSTSTSTSGHQEQAMASKQSDDMVKLLETSSILVSRNKKRKILAAAKKKRGKEGYIAMYQLCGEVFTSTEMANSKGLGIAKSVKATDPRPALDQQKIKDLKDFVTAWCKASKFQEPTESDLNNACTERIGYARKQEKKTNEKRDN